MNRREFVLSGLALAGAGVGGYSLLNRDDSPGSISATRVRVVRDTGTSSVRIPAPGGLTIVDFFATYCSGCEEQIASLLPIYRDADIDPSIISLTTQSIDSDFTTSDLREWWDRKGGPWPVGIDDGSLASAVGVETLPTIAIIGADGAVHWVESKASTTAIRERLRSTNQSTTAGT